MHEDDPAPASSLQMPASASTAVELPIAAPPPRRDYATGLALGAALFAIGAQVAHSIALADDSWSRFVPTPSRLYQLVSGQPWRLATPVALAALVIAAHATTRGRRWPAFVALALALAVLGVTYYGARNPI